MKPFATTTTDARTANAANTIFARDSTDQCRDIPTHCPFVPAADEKGQDVSDLEAMREIVRQEAIRGDRWEVIVEQFEAAADEVDRLRGRLHHVEGEAVPEAIRMWQKEHDATDRLRAVIENAPHDLTKQHAWHGLDMTLCRCWKADAL